MGIQKYRADFACKNDDDSVSWFARWMGSPSLAKIQNCRIDGYSGRLTVYVTGEPDTYLSQPAATRHKGKYVAGYLTRDESGPVFHAMDRHKARLA